jgi:hypothetical protein
MEGHCLTGQNPQRAVAPMEEERKEEFRTDCGYIMRIHIHRLSNISIFEVET